MDCIDQANSNNTVEELKSSLSSNEAAVCDKRKIDEDLKDSLDESSQVLVPNEALINENNCCPPASATPNGMDSPDTTTATNIVLESMNTLNSSSDLSNVLNALSINSKLNCDDPLHVDVNDTQDHIISANRGICYTRYKNENQMTPIINLITKGLSEPYSIYTYRYFIHNWPRLCFLAIHDSQYVGAIVCKLGVHKQSRRRGYIAMLAVSENVRRKKIGSTLVKLAIESMVEEGCDEVVLETEVTNSAALNLYENLGFVRDKRLYRYYLNGVDALRLKLWLT